MLAIGISAIVGDIHSSVAHPAGADQGGSGKVWAAEAAGRAWRAEGCDEVPTF
jgi:hypothetical protein